MKADVSDGTSLALSYMRPANGIPTVMMLNLKITKTSGLATILITLIGSASVCIAPLTFAQSDDGSAPSVSESDVIPGPPVAVPADLTGPSNSATENSSGKADDSSVPAAFPTDWEQVPETNSDATSGEEGQVLEIARPLDAAQASAPNRDDSSPAQASNDGQNDGSPNDELGGLNEYQQDQNAELSGGYYIPVPVPVRVGPGFAGARMGGGGPISPPFPGGGFVPTPPIILRPGGLAGIPSTSPMLTPPRGSAAMPNGWSAFRTH
jgi:hypothetical protein